MLIFEDMVFFYWAAQLSSGEQKKGFFVITVVSPVLKLPWVSRVVQNLYGYQRDELEPVYDVHDFDRGTKCITSGS